MMEDPSSDSSFTPIASPKHLAALWNDPAVSDLERAIAAVQVDNCMHPVHLHSFQQVSFSLSFRKECVSCHQRLQTLVASVWGSDSSQQVVQCLACGVWAHRKCVGINCKELCTVNGSFLQQEQRQEPEEALPTWTLEGPPQHWAAAASPKKFMPPQSPTRNKENETATREPSPESPAPPAVQVTSLHHARHPFASVSRALQENIAAHLDRLKEELVVVPRNDDCLDESMRSEEEKKDGQIEDEAYEPLPNLVPSPLNAVFQKHGAAVVAGSVVGGLAGLALAGPAGALAGSEFAGALGLLLEGSVTVGVFVASVATGGVTAKHIQTHVERRVLTMGEEGVARKVVLVRPNIQIDPAWIKICAQAKRGHTGTGGAVAMRFLPPQLRNQDSRTRHDDSDIVQVHEDEIPTTDKVLLLVSRILNDRESLPGHVYRSLIQAFADRCQARTTDPEAATCPRARRDDAHAVIKHVTATLLEVQPELASSSAMTELTATTVESRVFGHLYDAVFEECQAETAEAEVALQTKIQAFEVSRGESSTIRLSEPALQLLSMLPGSHAAVPKLEYCVRFLEILAHQDNSDGGADFLLARVCHHALRVAGLQAQVAFLEEFARDEYLLRGREGYALVTLQAALHFLNTADLAELFQPDPFDDDEAAAETACA